MAGIKRVNEWVFRGEQYVRKLSPEETEDGRRFHLDFQDLKGALKDIPEIIVKTGKNVEIYRAPVFPLDDKGVSKAIQILFGLNNSMQDSDAYAFIMDCLSLDDRIVELSELNWYSAETSAIIYTRIAKKRARTEILWGLRDFNPAYNPNPLNEARAQT